MSDGARAALRRNWESISALTLTTDYSFVNQALKALESILDLPPHHTPYRQEFLIKQV